MGEMWGKPGENVRHRGGAPSRAGVAFLILLAVCWLLVLAWSVLADAQSFYEWRYRSHATDCTALTDGKLRDLCFEIDSNRLFKCQPDAGDCSGTEWKLVAGSITDVWSCVTGNCNALTGAAGDSFDAGSADASSPATRSATLPGTCTEGQMHQDTDSGGTETYVCTATNTWTKLASTAATSGIGTCGANTFASTLNADAAPTCTQPAFSNLSGTASDAQVPNLNALSTGLTASRCVETDGSGLLTVAAGVCGVATGDIESVLGDLTGAVPFLFQTATAFGAADTTPNVSAAQIFKTADTTVFTDFDDGTDHTTLQDGKHLLILFQHAGGLDCTGSQITCNNYGLDWTAADGEFAFCVFDDTTDADGQWLCNVSQPRCPAGQSPVAGTCTDIMTQTEGDAKVTGPASATDNAIVRYDGTTGKLVQNSGCTVDDNGVIDCAAHATDGGQVCLKEGADDGTNQVCDKVPDSGLSASLTNTLNADGTRPGTAIAAATDTARGTVELATTAETTTGTDTTRAVTPDGLANSTVTRSIYIPAGSMDVSGGCSVNATAVLVASGPKLVTIACTDADADSIEFDFVLPDGWNAGTITVELNAFSIGNNNTEIFEMDFAGQCVRSDDSPAAHSTTGEQAATITWGNAANREQHATTAAITLNGTCAAGAHVYMRGQVDATATTMTPITDLKILGVKVEYTRTRGSD